MILCWNLTETRNFGQFALNHIFSLKIYVSRNTSGFAQMTQKKLILFLAQKFAKKFAGKISKFCAKIWSFRINPRWWAGLLRLLYNICHFTVIAVVGTFNLYSFICYLFREYRRAFEKLNSKQLSLVHPSDYPPGILLHFIYIYINFAWLSFVFQFKKNYLKIRELFLLFFYTVKCTR